MINVLSKPTFAFRPYDGERSISINSQVHSLEQGLSTFVFPSTHRDSGTFDIRVLGSESDVATAQSILNSIDHYGREQDASEVVAHAGNAIAREICSKDAVAMFELCRSDDDLTLVAVNPRHVGEVGGWLYGRRDTTWASWKPVVATGRRFWITRFPASLGGSRKYRRLLSDLSRMGPYMPRFRIESNSYSLEPAMSGYKADYVSFLTSSTRKLGWYAGGDYFEHCSEYYMLYRSLNAKRAKLLLRQHILDSMNNFFQRISLDCHVEVSGGVTLTDCDAYEEKLREGRITTNDLSTWIHQEG